MRQRLRRFRNWMWSLEIVRYGMVGVANTVGNYLLFVALHLLLGDLLGYQVVLVLAFVVAAVIAHRGHSAITFRAAPEGTLLRFMTVSTGLLVVNEVLLTVAVEHYGIPVLLAQAVLTAVVAVSGFLLHQRFTYAHADPRRAGSGRPHGDDE